MKTIAALAAGVVMALAPGLAAAQDDTATDTTSRPERTVTATTTTVTTPPKTVTATRTATVTTSTTATVKVVPTKTATTGDDDDDGDEFPAWGWLLIGLAVIAIGLGIYAVSTRDRGGRRPTAGRAARERSAAARSVTAIVARWEWRTFGEDFDAAVDERFDASVPESAGDSDETYVLSTQSEASVKVRDGLVDVKLLEETGDDGLERWRPALKAGFPLSPADVEVLLTALGIPGAAVLPLRVRKRRERHVLDGCMAERSWVRVDESTTRTIAVESADPGLVRATVRELGFDGRPNVSMPRQLKALAGFDAALR